MPKTVVFIDNFDVSKVFLKISHSYLDQDTICIVNDALALVTLKEKGIHCKTVEEFRNSKEHEEAQNLALVLAEQWFIDNEGNDITVYEGISLGKSLKISVFKFFLYLIKAILDVSNIIKQENPDRVFFVDDVSISKPRGSLYIYESSHKKAFQVLKSEKGFDFEVINGEGTEDVFKRKIFNSSNLKIRKILSRVFICFDPNRYLHFLKKILIFLVDAIKTLLFVKCNNNDSIRALALNASDLTFFGKDLVESYLRKSNHFLYYLEDEMNCYFNLRLIHLPLSRYITSKIKKNICKLVLDSSFLFEKLKKSEKINPKLIFGNLSLFNISEKYFFNLIKTAFPDLIQFIILVERVIQHEKINIVLVSEIWGAKRIILSQIAKRNSISVLHIPHGAVNGVMGENNKIIEHPQSDIKHFPFYPSHEIEGFKYNYDLQIHRGISQDQLFLTGIPRFGNLSKRAEKMRYEARKRLKFSENDEVVLFGTSHLRQPSMDKLRLILHPTSFEMFQLNEALIELFSKRKNSRFVFKLKAGDASEYFIKNVISMKAIKNISVFMHQLHDLFLVADAVLIINSNIGIEALYYDIPVIVYNIPGRPLAFPLVVEKVALAINSPEELIPILDRLRNDEDFRNKRLKIQRDFLLNNLPDNSISAADRASEVIVKLANHKPCINPDK
tara:strand:- start:2072 stop:4087 length:2016 start_codon:yes stop_codon:yes gene_type:complete